MMKPTRQTMIGVAVTGLMLAAVVTPAAMSETTNGGIVQISAMERPDGRSTMEMPRGIRTYGVRALQLETPGSASHEAGQAKSGNATRATESTAAAIKISGATMAGGLTAFAVSPNGTTAVFIADKDTAGRYELFSAPVDGASAPVKLSTGLAFGSGDVGVSSFQITPDGTRVVFLADANHGGGTDDIFSVPVDGSAAPSRLNDGTEAPVSAFGLSPDGVRTAFFGIDTTFGSGGVELYSASVGVTSSATQISDAGSANGTGDVIFADFSPDSATTIYAADSVADGVFQWFSVAADAVAPGTDVQLSSAVSEVNRVAVSPDSRTVVYTADEISIGVLEVFSVPIGGGSATRLNPAMAGSGATEIEICSDGTCVAYLADQDTAGVVEVYRASLGVGGSGVRLSTPMSGRQATDTLNVSPDSTTVLYEADQNTPDTFELFRVPTDTSASPSELHGLTPPDNAGYFSGIGTPIIGRRAVYPVLGAAVDLFSVPFDGSESFTRVNDALTSGDTVFSAFLPAHADRLMAYGVGPDTDTVTRKVYVGAIRGDLPREQINVTAAAGALGAVSFELTSNESHAVYVQDQDTSGKLELYSAALDSDADAVANFSDNCPFVSNAQQDPVTFGRTVFATDSTTFAWGAPAEVRFARGPLEMVSSLVTNDSGALHDQSSYTDPDSPLASSGFFYLFATDCPGRSYQTAPGEEPQRDLADLP